MKRNFMDPSLILAFFSMGALSLFFTMPSDTELAALRFQSFQPELAEPILRRAMLTKMPDAVALRQMVDVLEVEGNVSEAIKILYDLTKLRPNNKNYWERLLRQLRWQGRALEAARVEEYLWDNKIPLPHVQNLRGEEVVTAPQSGPARYLRLAHDYEWLQSAPDALRVYEKIWRQSLLPLDDFNRWLRTLASQGNFKRAFEILGDDKSVKAYGITIFRLNYWVSRAERNFRDTNLSDFSQLRRALLDYLNYCQKISVREWNAEIHAFLDIAFDSAKFPALKGEAYSLFQLALTHQALLTQRGIDFLQLKLDALHVQAGIGADGARVARQALREFLFDDNLIGDLKISRETWRSFAQAALDFHDPQLAEQIMQALVAGEDPKAAMKRLKQRSYFLLKFLELLTPFPNALAQSAGILSGEELWKDYRLLVASLEAQQKNEEARKSYMELWRKLEARPGLTKLKTHVLEQLFLRYLWSGEASGLLEFQGQLKNFTFSNAPVLTAIGFIAKYEAGGLTDTEARLIGPQLPRLEAEIEKRLPAERLTLVDVVSRLQEIDLAKRNEVAAKSVELQAAEGTKTAEAILVNELALPQSHYFGFEFNGVFLDEFSTTEKNLIFHTPLKQTAWRLGVIVSQESFWDNHLHLISPEAFVSYTMSPTLAWEMRAGVRLTELGDWRGFRPRLETRLMAAYGALRYGMLEANLSAPLNISRSLVGAGASESTLEGYGEVILHPWILFVQGARVRFTHVNNSEDHFAFAQGFGLESSSRISFGKPENTLGFSVGPWAQWLRWVGNGRLASGESLENLMLQRMAFGGGFISFEIFCAWDSLCRNATNGALRQSGYFASGPKISGGWGKNFENGPQREVAGNTTEYLEFDLGDFVLGTMSLHLSYGFYTSQLFNANAPGSATEPTGGFAGVHVAKGIFSWWF